MANSERLGATFSIDTTALKAGLAEANRAIRESESEFKAAASGMGDWTQSSEGLEARIKHLNMVIQEHQNVIDKTTAEKDKIVAAMQAEGRSQDEINKVVDEANKILNKEYDALNKAQKELAQYGDENKEASKNTDELADSIDKSSKGLDSLKKVGGIAGKAIAAVGAAAAAAVASFLSLAESTREYREDMSKLQAGFQSAGLSAETATETYKDFYAILGEEDRSVEAVNHLAQLCTTQEELNKWTDIATGVWATFGDSLPIEGLTEASNETAKTGQLTGVLADALNWAGINEEDFQKKLDGCNSEQERATLITETLNGLYDDAADKYKELNGDVMDARRAQSELTDAIAQLGAIAEPIMTTLKTLAADLLKEITPFVELIGSGLSGALQGAEGATDDLAEGIGGLIDKLVDTVTKMLPAVIDTISALIPTIINTLLDATPDILAAVIKLVDSIIDMLADTLPAIVEKVVETIGTLIIRIVEQAPLLLEAALTLFNSLVEAIPVIIEQLLQVLPNIINAIVEFIIDSIPVLLDAAIQLLNTLIDAIPIIIEALVENLPRIINSIVNGLIDALPLVLDGAVTLMMAIVNAIPQIIPQLVAALPRIITTIVTTLTNNIPAIVNAAVQLFMGIIQAIPQIIQALLQNLPTIISSIVQGLLDGIPQLIQAGIELLKGLFVGLLDPRTLWECIKAVGNAILDGIKSFFGIKSPSRVFRDEIGKNLALGLGEGFEDNISGVKDQMVKSMDGMTAELGDINLNASNGSSKGQQGKNIVVNQYNTFSQSKSRYELFKSKQATAAAVRLAMGGVEA